MHENLCLKHGIKPSPPSKVMNKITYAKLFERFDKVSGMTGTAQESSSSFWEHYGLSVRVLPDCLLISGLQLNSCMPVTDLARPDLMSSAETAAGLHYLQQCHTLPIRAATMRLQALQQHGTIRADTVIINDCFILNSCSSA